MQVLEFARGTSKFALGIVVTPESPDAFTAETPLVKRALVDFRAKHRDGCVLVRFTIVSAQANHDAIESQLRRIYDEEVDLSSFLRSLEVQVALLEPGGQPVKEYVLGARPSDTSAPRKPWWRFW